MAAPTNRAKIGLFVLIGVAAAMTIVITIGVSRMHPETIAYYSYFNESVQGLDVGASVKFRGVTIGHVADIAIAPDHRMIEVKQDIIVKDIERLGLAESRQGTKAHFNVPPDLRATLGSQALTGVKYIAIDFFDPRINPPPVLSFKPRENYIPSAPSMVKNLEDILAKAMERLPELVDATVAVVARIERLVAVLEREDFSDKAAQALSRADDVLATLGKTLARIDRENFPERSAQMLDEINATIGKVNEALDRIDGNAGLLVTAQRTIASFGEAGRSATGMTRELDATLREVRGAAESIRELAESIDRDPDMLVKGRPKAKVKSP